MSKEKASQRINSKNHQPGGKRISPIFVVGISLVVLVIIGVVLWTLSGKVSKSNVVVTPDNVDDVISDMDDDDRTPVGSYEVTMNSDWVFPSASSTSTNAYVENSVNNTDTVFFTIALDGSEKDIFTSPYIPVGSSLKDISLDSDLAAGVYDAVLTYHLVDSSYTETSSVSVSITITIEN